MVTKNKTKFRPSLKIDGTLSSILTIKLAKSEPCNKFSPTANLQRKQLQNIIGYIVANNQYELAISTLNMP